MLVSLGSTTSRRFLFKKGFGCPLACGAILMLVIETFCFFHGWGDIVQLYDLVKFFIQVVLVVDDYAVFVLFCLELRHWDIFIDGSCCVNALFLLFPLFIRFFIIATTSFILLFGLLENLGSQIGFNVSCLLY